MSEVYDHTGYIARVRDPSSSHNVHELEGRVILPAGDILKEAV